jgi:flavoprotein
MGEKRIAWAITGAGHILEECAGMLLEHEKVDISLSRAAGEVLRLHNLPMRASMPCARIHQETPARSPLLAPLWGGVHPVPVIAPATSDSVAQFVHGISDGLAPNMFAQAVKSHVPVIVYPTGLAPATHSLGPDREPVRIYPRPIDMENTGELRAFAGVHAVSNREELAR